jgi:putative acetyltransferase
VQIRTQRPGERDAVRDVLLRSFDRVVVADLAEALQDARYSGVVGPERAGLSFVAEIDGDVVGHVQLSRSWLDAPERLVEVLVLSPLGVVPEHQGRGIGGRLVQHAVQEATELAPMIFLEGSPDYYSRFGFETAGRRGFTSPSVRIPDDAFQVLILPSYQPWMTGALVYAEPFWVFDCVGLRA